MNTSSIRSNDPLAYLPRRPLTEYSRGTMIYAGNCEALYLLVSGRVKVATTGSNGREATLRIVAAEGLFGECCLLMRQVSEHAVALDKVQLMAWTRAEVRQEVEREPRLGLALIEELIISKMEMEDRIQASAFCSVPQRLMLSLLQLARELGEEQPDGALQMPSLTHQVIAEYVGTTRENLSVQMRLLSHLKLIRYTRKHIQVYCEAMEKALRNNGVGLRQSHVDSALRRTDIRSYADSAASVPRVAL
jgi:CRP-like cAMP-binding protein